MAFVKVRVPRTSQPQDACGIDRGNAFGKNVVFASPDSLSSQDRVATRIGTVTKKPTVNGTAAEFNGTSWVEYGTKPIIQPNSAFTISLYEETAVVGTVSSLFSIPVGSNQFIFLRGTSAEYRCTVGIAGGSGGYDFAGAGSQTAGEKIRFVITGSNISDRTTYKLWANGVKHTGIARTFGSLPAQSIKIGWAGADTKFNGLIQDFFALDREVSDAEAIAITDNPWQIFEPEELTIWMPGEVGAGGTDHLVTPASSQQPNTASACAITQTHLIGAAHSTQANTAGGASVWQTHQVGASSSTQANVGTAGSVSQGSITQVTAANSTQPNTASAGSIAQTHQVGAASSGTGHTGTAAAVSQTHLISAASSQQANTATAGSVSQSGAQTASAANSVHANTASAGGISQTHLIVCAPVAVDNVASASSIVQTHLIGAASSVQGNRCSAGSASHPAEDSPSIYTATSPAQSYQATSPAQSYST